MSKSTSRDFCLFFSAEIRECAFAVKIWMDGYFVYRRSTLKGHIASNKMNII